METLKTVVLVLRSGGDFTFEDVRLIANRINGLWQSPIRPRIICLWDKASMEYELGNLTIIPLKNELSGTWSRIELYSPEMDKYRPFLYVDLDTAIIKSLELIFDIITDKTKFITLEDFWDKGQMATGLVWFPKDNELVKKIWKSFKGQGGRRMDHFLRRVIKPDMFFQQLTNSIMDFKPRRNQLLDVVPDNASIVCFHGKPRILEAQNIPWVKEYVQTGFSSHLPTSPRVTVIIPYKIDRGWLNDAITSVPKEVQLLVSQGEGNWCANFNKVLDQARGEFIRWLHEDDMLTINCIEDSLKAFEDPTIDFIHGQAWEFYMGTQKTVLYKPAKQNPTLQDLLEKNVLHSATMMYRKDVFEKVGRMDETLNTAEEYEFNLRCLKAGLKLGYCPKPLAIYRRHPEQKVRVVSSADKSAEREMVRKRFK